MFDFFKIPPIIARRMEDANKRALKRMGEDIARIGSLNNYKDAQLVAVKLTGESVDEITRELSKASGMTEAEIEKLYADAARYDYEFAEQFYLNREQIPFEENKTLQRTVKALTRASQTYCENLSHSYAFALRDPDGRIRYTSLRAGYKEAIDKAVTAVRFGTTDYKAEMRRVLKQYADSGVRIVDWESGYSQRIDTAVRRNIMEGLRRVKNETQNQIGKEFGADGYEISAHENPAPDHADIQGRQFSFADFEALNESLKRPIGTLNCYHTVTAIILGISPPAYTEAQLQEMKRKSNELINIDGKKYSRYDCTQLQRQIETKIRKLKDRKELFKAAGDDVGVRECNRKIRLLKNKYNEITQKAGLNAHYDRMSVVKSNKAVNERQYGVMYGENAIHADMDYINSKEYKNLFSRISDNPQVNKTLHESAVATIKNCSGTEYENMYLINAENGKVISKITDSNIKKGIIYTDDFRKALHDSKTNGVPIIAMHNHPQGTPPSTDDFRKAYENGYQYGVVCGHNGQIYVYTAPTTPMSEETADNLAAEVQQLIFGGMDVDRACKIVYNDNNIDYTIISREVNP